MKCEICHSADAKVAVRRVVDGRERELYVCRGCAAGDDEAAAPAADAMRGSIKVGKAIGGEVPGAVIGEILKHIFEPGMVEAKILQNPTAPLAEGRPCPVCGMRPDDYKRTGRLGCEACYEAFARQLAPMVRDMHPGAAHAGKVPDAVARAREK